MNKKELLNLKKELLKAIKNKNKYPTYITTSSNLVTATDLQKLDKITQKNREKNEYFQEKINIIKEKLRNMGYPIDEIFEKWDKLLLHYNNLQDKEIIKIILLGKKYPSLKKIILQDIDIDQYINLYEEVIENRKNK